VSPNHFQMENWQRKSLLHIQHVSWRLATANHWFTSFCLFISVEMVDLTVNNVSCEQSIYESRGRVSFKCILWPFREWVNEWVTRRHNTQYCWE
jgi:hypothetical protein